MNKIPGSALALAVTVSILAGAGPLAATPASTGMRRVPTVTAASAPRDAVALPMLIGGRTERRGTPAASIARQWPGSYFDTAFAGRDVFMRIGEGDVSLRVTADGGASVALVKPAPGYYRIAGLGTGAHRLRVQVVSESQDAPSSFGGFYAGKGTTARPLRPRPRQIEFIGDSHTVGYGNTAATTTCTTDEVWATTNTALGVAGQTARRYGADYQVNAISGRGVVRNYGGFAADTLPEAYPFVLFDKKTRDVDRRWHPQVIVVSLGTNDFSTPLHAGERWQDRDALHRDYEASYAAFLHTVRVRHPRAFIILWATTMAQGEIAAESGKVVARMASAGDRRVAFVPVERLALSGCHGHPSVADDGVISDAIGRVIDRQGNVWKVGAR